MIKLKTIGITVCLVFFVSFVMAQDKRYRFDGWCLSYDPEALPDGARDVTIPGPFPSFLIPSDLQTLSPRDNPSATGIVATFSKMSEGSWQSLSESPRPSSQNCTRADYDFGLVELSREASNMCVLSDRSRHFEPETRTDLSVGIRVRCSNNETVLACNLGDIYPSDWRVRISLPKPDIGRWQEATADVRAFFDAHINDCGV
ncbi:MAG: hypothetical protein AAFU41_10210 [Pseudomonadota bacterium]